MAPTEQVLAVVEEECGEVAQVALRAAQAASKALRFGADDGYAGTDRTNRGDLVREVNDLLGSLEHLAEALVQGSGLQQVESLLQQATASGRPLTLTQSIQGWTLV